MAPTDRRGEPHRPPVHRDWGIAHGFRKGTKFEENARKLREFLAEPQVEVHPVTFRTAEIYGEFVNYLQQQGTPIPTNDIRIAA